MKKKRVLIYPYCRDAFPLISNLELENQEYEITHIVSHKYMGTIQKDAGIMFNYPKFGRLVEYDFEHCLIDSDVLIVVEDRNMTDNSQIKKNINISLMEGKQVICCSVLDEEYLSSLERYRDKGQFIYIIDNFKEGPFECKDSYKEIIQSKVPVIFIGETSSDLDSYNILTETALYFRKKGYTVTAIGSEKYGLLIGNNNIPTYIGSNVLPIEEQIIKFNRQIYELEMKENPDIILIQAPGGIIRYNNKISNNFGIVPFIVTQAITADYMILNTNYEVIENEYFNIMKEICKYKFGTDLYCVNMSNLMISVQDTIQENAISFLQIQQNKLNKNIVENYSDNMIPIYNMHNRKQQDDMLDKLVEKLTGNSVVEKIV